MMRASVSGIRKRVETTAATKPAPLLDVGSAILAKCGKCKKITSHTVVAKIGLKPTQVQCLSCTQTHDFRAPNRDPEARAKPGVPLDLDPEKAWAGIMRRTPGIAIGYSRGGHYNAGQRLNHPDFGEGVVTRLLSTTICEVVFMTRTVKLLMGN